MINKVVVDLQAVCTCKKMTIDPDWQFLCISHPKPMDYTAMDYGYHTIDTIQCLITNPSFYPSREHVPDKEYSTYPNMRKESIEFLLMLVTNTQSYILNRKTNRVYIVVLLIFVYNLS
jgi:hypothetical protein